jgi:hypothetical protein
MTETIKYSLILLTFLFSYGANEYRLSLGSNDKLTENSEHAHHQATGLNQKKYVLTDDKPENVASNLALSPSLKEQESEVIDELPDTKPIYTQAQKEKLSAEYQEVYTLVYDLKQRYELARARLNALKSSKTKLDNRLVDTPFELLEEKLSAAAWEAKLAFDSKPDDDNYSFELETIISDYFILNEKSDQVRLHLIKCKSLYCYAYIYHDKKLFTSGGVEILQNIGNASGSYQIEVHSFRNFWFDDSQYKLEQHDAASLVYLSAKKLK